METARETQVSVAAAVESAWIGGFGRSSFELNLPLEEAGADSLDVLAVVFEIERLLNMSIPLDVVSAGLTPQDLLAAVIRLRQSHREIPQPDEKATLFMMAGRETSEDLATALRNDLTRWFRVQRLDPDTRMAIAGSQIDRLTVAIAELRPVGAVHIVAFGRAAGVASAVSRKIAAERGRKGLTVLIDPPSEPGSPTGATAQLSDEPWIVHVPADLTGASERAAFGEQIDPRREPRTRTCVETRQRAPSSLGALCDLIVEAYAASDME
jgi:acyl carrier protein